MIRLNFSQAKQLQTDKITMMTALTAQHGHVIQAKMFGMKLCFISEPTLTRELLLKQAANLQRDAITRTMFQRITGDGVLVAEGPQWQRQRKLVQPAFHALRIKAYADIMATYTQDMLANWQAGSTVSFEDAFTALTLRIIARTMYGVDLEPQVAEIGALMGKLSKLGEDQLGMPMVPPLWIPTRHNRQQKATRAAVEKILKEIIADRKQAPAENDDLLSMLLLARDEDGQPMTETQLVDECFTLFFAGHETTAAALTWATYLLTQHPDCLETAQAEIAAVLGERAVTFEDLPKLPYVEAVIKETLRLYPSAPAIAREVITPFEAGGYDFQKKALLIFNIHATHHREDLFANADEFQPERFLDPDRQPDRFAYMPFGGGSRYCVGQLFAMMEATIILTTLLQNVSFARVDTAPAVMEARITLRMRDPLRMRVQPL